MAPRITEISPQTLKGLLPDNLDTCTLEVTVPTGLEDVAAAECCEKLGVKSYIEAKGRVFIDVEIADVPKVLLLRSIDNVNVVLSMTQSFGFTKERDHCFREIYKHAEKPDWRKGMRVWRERFNYPEEPITKMSALKDEHCEPKPEVDLKRMKSTRLLNSLPLSDVPEHLRRNVVTGGDDGDSGSGDDSGRGRTKLSPPPSNTSPASPKKRKEDPDLTAPSEPVKEEKLGPKFRVSCSRAGSTHSFGSPEAARQFGAGVNDVFGWPVNLNNYDVEILLCIDQEFVYVAICLTREPLFKRNITYFGRTNLRSTICYNMMRIAAPKLGEVVVDPMCGGATIPMEGSLTHPGVFHLCGDNDHKAVKRSRDNLNHIMKKRDIGESSLVVDVARWDVTRLPLRNQCVDVMVSDLPFGKRVGKKSDNRVLYYQSLLEMARVTRMDTGRAVLLTYDQSSMIKNIKRVGSLWKSGASRTVNVGGLSAIIYTLHRTSQLNLSKGETQIPTVSTEGS